MDPGVSVQKQNFTRSPEKLAKVPGTREEAKSHLHWQFLGIRQSLWRSLLESLHVLHHTDRKQMGLLKEQCAEWKKAPLLYCCNQVWMKVGGQILWIVTPICETSQIYYLMGRRPMKDVLGNHLKDRFFPFGSFVEYHPITAKEQSRIHQFGKKVLPGYCSSDTHCTRWEFGRVTYWLQTLRSWRRWTHRKSTQKDSMRKRWYFPKKKEKIIFPIADGRIKPLEEIKTLRTSTLIRHRPLQGDSHVDFLAESEGSLPPPHDSFPDAGEAINDFWSISGNFIYRHHVEPRAKLYSPREEPFPIPLKYIDVSRTTCTNLDAKQGLLEDRFHSV